MRLELTELTTNTLAAGEPSSSLIQTYNLTTGVCLSAILILIGAGLLLWSVLSGRTR